MQIIELSKGFTATVREDGGVQLERISAIYSTMLGLSYKEMVTLYAGWLVACSHPPPGTHLEANREQLMEWIGYRIAQIKDGFELETLQNVLKGMRDYTPKKDV